MERRLPSINAQSMLLGPLAIRFRTRVLLVTLRRMHSPLLSLRLLSLIVVINAPNKEEEEKQWCFSAQTSAIYLSIGSDQLSFCSGNGNYYPKKKRSRMLSSSSCARAIGERASLAACQLTLQTYPNPNRIG